MHETTEPNREASLDAGVQPVGRSTPDIYSNSRKPYLRPSGRTVQASHAIAGASLTGAQHQHLAAVGPGKSTLLRIIVFVPGMNVLLFVMVMSAAVFVGWIYLDHVTRQEQVASRRLLDDRAAALFARAVAPGSTLSCLNELSGEAVEAACAKALFASPEAVAAAVNYVTAELALLADASDHVRLDPAYALELAPIRTALELDRFGIVAHVLAEGGCKKCDALHLFNDSARVSDNLRDHTFDDLVTKFITTWNTPRGGAAATSTDATLPVPALRPVSPQYDFPSAASIPPIDIMVPEIGTRKSNPASQAGAPRQAVPLPPRRPPVAAARRLEQRPVAPAAARATPADDAATMEK